MKVTMKKILRGVCTLVIMLSAMLMPHAVKAASYPTVNAFSVHASIGEEAVIVCQYLPAYNNERLYMDVYDSSNRLVASTEHSFNNKYASAVRYWTVGWDTTGKAAGTYKVVITKEFYSYYSWHTAPTTSTAYVYLYDDLSGVSGNNMYTGNDTVFTCVQSGEQYADNNMVCTAVSAWKNTLFGNYSVQLKEMYMGAEATEIVKEENIYNYDPTSEMQWYLMKYEIKNNSSQTIEASDIISSFSFYKYTGSKITVSETAAFSGELSKKDIDSVNIGAGETKEVWLGICVPKVQQMPYLKINDTYLNINPLYAASNNTSVHNKVIDAAIPATCTTNGLSEGEHCLLCNAVIKEQEVVKATGHSWDKGKVTKKAAVNSKGVKEYSCVNSGCEEIKTESIPAKLKQKITTSKIKSYKASTLKNKKVTFHLKAKASGKGKLTYKVVKYPKGMKKYISVTKKGKVTLKKGAKKGTYKIKISAAAKGRYASVDKTISIKVK